MDRQRDAHVVGRRGENALSIKPGNLISLNSINFLLSALQLL